MSNQPILIDGQWRQARAASTFQACDPQNRELLPDVYPVSQWEDCDEALTAATRAADQLRQLPGERFAQLLEALADKIEAKSEALVSIAHQETALPQSPRLADVELPRTTGQLRQAAAAARDASWMTATIDTAANIRSHYAPLGPVCVFGPNNFPALNPVV